MIKFEDIKQKYIDRFWLKFKKGKDGECDEWIGYRDKDGYGELLVKINGKWTRIKAHRFAWMIYHNQNIPEGMVIMHICDRPCCISEKCLKLGTVADNNQDRTKKGRSAKYWLGKKHTLETNLRISISKMGKNMGNKSMSGLNHTQETKEKMRISHTGTKHTEECRLKMIAGIKKAYTQERRDKKAKENKKRWEDPEYRVKMIEVLKKAREKYAEGKGNRRLARLFPKISLRYP